MRVPIYCSETFEALTIIKIEKWGLEMLESGCVYLRFAPPPKTDVNAYAYSDVMNQDVFKNCEIRFDRICLKGMTTWVGVTGDSETALALRSVFLPGQQSEVRQCERDAQVRMLEGMINRLSR